MASLRLKPSRMKEITSLLQHSYKCIEPKIISKTSAKELKKFPSKYLEGMIEKGEAGYKQYSKEHCQQKMDWAAWELARSTLDESIKTSVGLLLYVDKVNNIEDDLKRHLKRLYIPSFDVRYISSFLLPALYFTHFESAMSGLFVAGLVARDGRLIARDFRREPRWRCINESWKEDWNRKYTKKTHTRIFSLYDSIQKYQTKWLPRRSDMLDSLKDLRETITYRTEEMGGWIQKERTDEFLEILPDHIDFQKSLLNSLCSVVKRRGIWDRSYDPQKRVEPLCKRFDQYDFLAKYVINQ